MNTMIHKAIISDWGPNIEFAIQMPMHAEVLTVQWQDSTNGPVIWYKFPQYTEGDEPGAPMIPVNMTERFFVMLWTGQGYNQPPKPHKYISTVLDPNGLVHHFFEVER